MFSYRSLLLNVRIKHFYGVVYGILWYAHAQSLQAYPTLRSPMDHSPPGSSVHGIFQARILEEIAMLSSSGSSPPRDQIQVSCIASVFFTVWVTPWYVLTHFLTW